MSLLNVMTDILAKVFSLVLSGKLAVSTTEGLRIFFLLVHVYAVRPILGQVLHICRVWSIIVVYFS